jgi:hypothetical protein
MNRKRVLLSTYILILSILVCTYASVNAVLGPPNLSSYTGQPGDIITVWGGPDSATPGGTVKIYWDIPMGPDAFLLNMINANPDGSYEADITLPQDTVGLHYIWVENTATVEYALSNGLMLVEPSIEHAQVEIKPDTLNLKSYGKWITCYIELAEGYDVADIDVSTVLLNDEIHAVQHPTAIGDYDGDGSEDLMVKFPRSGLGNYSPSDEVELTVSGTVGSTQFEGSDNVRLICYGKG